MKKEQINKAEEEVSISGSCMQVHLTQINMAMAHVPTLEKSIYVWLVILILSEKSP